MELACANPAEDFGQDLALQRGGYERYDAADWKDIFGSLPQAANYS